MSVEPRNDGGGLGTGARIAFFVAGLACFSAAFAIFGLGFDFIDMTIRDDWPRWLVFATFPLICISVLIVLVIGGGLVGYAFHSDAPDTATPKANPPQGDAT